MVMTLSLTADPTPGDLETISGNLTAFNQGDAGPAERLALAALLRDDGGGLVGGLSGYTAWGWLYVQWLWIAEGQRGAGWAGKLLAAAEHEARARGCHGAYIDTFNPVALKTYLRQGYRPFGALDGFPKGRTRTFLQKPL